MEGPELVLKYSPALITGAASQVGRFLLPMLSERGFRIYAVSRFERADPALAAPGVEWITADLREGLGEAGEAVSMMHIAPLWLLPENIERAAALGVKRLIAFGSTSVHTKKDSASPADRETARRLAEAEEAVRRESERFGAAWTIFRPTMIYGAGMDRNVTAIADFVRRFGFFPVAGRGEGLRQPVHAADLAAACAAALDELKTFNRAYDLGGGEALPYRRMVEKIFEGMGRKPRIISVPPPLLRLAAALAGRATGNRDISAGMVDRMNADMCFDISGASRDFGYSPRGFSFE